MSDRLARLAPFLIGVVFVVLAFLGGAVVGSTPSTTASGPKVLAFYDAHHGRVGNGGFLTMLSVVAGLFFYGLLRSYLSRSPRAEWLAFLGFGGAVIFGVGAVVGAGVDFAFWDVGDKLSAQTAQVLNVLQSDLNGMLFAAGLAGLMLAFGIAMLRSRLLPLWLGWITIAIGVLAAAGPGISLAIPLEGVWVLVTGFMLSKRNALASEPADALP